MPELAVTARAVVFAAFAAVIAPPPQIAPAQWAAENLIVPDGPHAGEKFDPRLTPYLAEPLDNMGADSAVNKQVIRKSAQTGFTMMGIAGLGYSIACDPAGGFLFVEPTQDALDKFLRDKFNPAAEASPALRARIAPQVSRSGEGSTAYNKRYPGGSTSFVIANSAAALRSMTKRRTVKDEASEYPPDLDGQGSPHKMIDARRISFLAAADWKETNISTPTVAGACYIDAEFAKGDQRYWHVDCPGCAAPFVFRFGPQFRFEDTFPHRAHYVAPCCGTVIEAHEKNALVRAGSRAAPRHGYLESLGLRNGWIATAPGPGKFPSYHFDALSSPFVPWDHIAAEWIDAQNNPQAVKGFYNLTRGEAYEVKGDAPDHERLFERREDYRRGEVPPRGLLLTTFADVQLRGIYWETVAFAPNRESWVVDAGAIAGDTTAANAGAFAELDALYRREYPDAFGGRRTVDAFGVDSGYHSHTVYDWCRSRHKAYATKGVKGWSRPALGMPTLQDIDLGGKKIAQGVKLWPIGTWALKGHWYEDLRREPSAGVFPPGYCHFGKFLDDNYFRQITAEYLLDPRARNYRSEPWQVRGKEDNHWLDCRIGNMALADHLGLTRMTAEEWRILARDRAAALLDHGDLFAPAPIAASAAALAAHKPPPPAGENTTAPPAPAAANTAATDAANTPAPSGWLGRDTSGWLDR